MNVCLYGASSKTSPACFEKACHELGALLAKENMGVVFGGGNDGLMGAAARGVKAEGGHLIGVAPRFFDREGILYQHCDELIFTETMRQRKQTMENLSDAFIMMPGGYGTLEEFFEVLTLKQLGRHEKAIVVLNCNGCFDEMLQMLARLSREQFIQERNLQLFSLAATPAQAVHQILTYQPPAWHGPYGLEEKYGIHQGEMK